MTTIGVRQWGAWVGVARDILEGFLLRQRKAMGWSSQFAETPTTIINRSPQVATMPPLFGELALPSAISSRLRGAVMDARCRLRLLVAAPVTRYWGSITFPGAGEGGMAERFPLQRLLPEGFITGAWLSIMAIGPACQSNWHAYAIPKWFACAGIPSERTWTRLLLAKHIYRRRRGKAAEHRGVCS